MSATPQETAVLGLIGRMLARTEYLLPIVAAERQIRDNYYRLNAAALLEDLFHDATTNYVKQREPTVSFSRADAGKKGWDYEIDGVRIAHKAFSGGNVSALWDATVKAEHWTFEATLLMVVASYKPTKIKAKFGRTQHALFPLSCRFPGIRESGNPKAPKPWGGDAVLLHWPPHSSVGKVLHVGAVMEDQQSPWKSIPFSELWRGLASRNESERANECEVLVSSRPGLHCAVGDQVHLEYAGRRPGIYLIPMSDLQHVPVKANNRGLLVDATLVKEWLQTAERDGLFVPMPLWYQGYAEDRPPDLYSIQRAEYDALFSARGFRR